VVHNHDESELANDVAKIVNEMKEFTELSGSSDFILALRSDFLLKDTKLLPAMLKYRPAYVEFFDNIDWSDIKVVNLIKLLRTYRIKIIYKILAPRILGKLVEFVDAIDVKGPDAAARVNTTTTTSLVDRIKQLKSANPHLHIIASGGMSSQQDVQACIDAGASAVALGTVFAMSEESSISVETKMKMIESTFSQVVNIGEAQQNALVFTNEKDVDGNHTVGLELGIKSPVAGHVFVGKAIDSIDSIKTVETIVSELTGVTDAKTR
jgi:CheY-like chemotaxis protein